MFGKKRYPAPLVCVGCGSLLEYVSKKVVKRGVQEGLYRCCPTCNRKLDSVRSYCGKCAPPYDIEEWTQTEVRYYVRQEVRVNKDGTPWEVNDPIL